MPRRAYNLGGALPGAQDTGGGFDDVLNKLLTFIKIKDYLDKTKLEKGSPATPQVVSETKPFFAGLRGYKPQEVPIGAIGPQPAPQPDDLTGLLTSSSNIGIDTSNPASPTYRGPVYSPLLAPPLESPVETAPLTKTVYVKPGSAGVMGTDELDRKLKIAPYIDASTDSNTLKDFFLRPGMPEDIQFGPRGQKKMEITQDLVDVFVGTPLEGKLTVGGIIPVDLYTRMFNAAQLSFRVGREQRLGETVRLGQELKEIELELKKSKLEKQILKTSVEKEVNAMENKKETKPAQPQKKGLAKFLE